MKMSSARFQKSVRKILTISNINWGKNTQFLWRIIHKWKTICLFSKKDLTFNVNKLNKSYFNSSLRNVRNYKLSKILKTNDPTNLKLSLQNIKNNSNVSIHASIFYSRKETTSLSRLIFAQSKRETSSM